MQPHQAVQAGGQAHLQLVALHRGSLCLRCIPGQVQGRGFGSLSLAQAGWHTGRGRRSADGACAQAAVSSCMLHKKCKEVDDTACSHTQFWLTSVSAQA